MYVGVDVFFERLKALQESHFVARSLLFSHQLDPSFGGTCRSWMPLGSVSLLTTFFFFIAVDL